MWFSLSRLGFLLSLQFVILFIFFVSSFFFPSYSSLPRTYWFKMNQFEDLKSKLSFFLTIRVCFLSFSLFTFSSQSLLPYRYVDLSSNIPYPLSLSQIWIFSLQASLYLSLYVPLFIGREEDFRTFLGGIISFADLFRLILLICHCYALCTTCLD